MMRTVAIVLAVCLLLSGCSAWQDGSYHSVKPHQEQSNQGQTDDFAVSSYTALYRAVESMVHNGKKSGIISVANYNQLVVARDMNLAVQKITAEDPLGTWAVENIHFELGTNSGEPAIAVEITYLHDYADFKKIQKVSTMAEAEAAIAGALESCDSGIVLYVDQYEPRDLIQWVDDYGDRFPEQLMELPQVTENLYPEEGTQRILELKFTYQNSRETLRDMQTQVSAVMTEITQGIRQELEENQQYNLLFVRLAGRFESIQLATSITPAYSLLVHGAGDSRAFATMYAALCRQMGMECRTVTGTRNGQPWWWNIVSVEDTSFHLDIVTCRENGQYILLGDEAMQSLGYVWDYSEYQATGEPTP